MFKPILQNKLNIVLVITVPADGPATVNMEDIDK